MRVTGFRRPQQAVHLDPWHHFLPHTPLEQRDTLKLLSYNIQVGIHTRQYRDYLLRAWQHVWPSHRREQNLQQIAELIRHFDLIALQEVDGGSFRTKYMNQVHYLAKAANKKYWHQQLNRNLGHFAQHSNGVIGDVKPVRVANHALPGLKGRGAIAFEIGERNPMLVIIAHLALSRQAQDRQLGYLAELVAQYPNAVIMGDLNTDSQRILEQSPLRDSGLKAVHGHATYPSWQPVKCLDHILISEHIEVVRTAVLDFALSDHLPVALEIRLPD